MRTRDIYLNIKVTNLDTKMTYEHRRVPLDHVEMIKRNSNLKVEILGSSFGANRNERTKEVKSG